MQLPSSNDLPIHHLAASFKNTSATYKFYWFLSIIQFAEQSHFKIQKSDLFAKMLANAWFTVNFFRVSFGSQDVIQQSIRQIKVLEDIPIEGNQETIFKILTSTSEPETLKILRHFDKNVPHWFLSHWFSNTKLRSDIYKESSLPESLSLYALFQDHIIVNPIWRDYLQSNAGVLKGFCYWNLALFLQGKNPNVPDIPSKLFKPAVRGSLSDQRKFWNLVFDEVEFITCIYSGERLLKGDYAVEHFIPYNFISHDLIWNLIPANKKFNSSKSDKLPSMERYFDSFFSIQKKAIEIVSRRESKHKLLQDYLTIFPDLKIVSTQPESFTKEKFRETIQPLITIASNNGFQFLP